MSYSPTETKIITFLKKKKRATGMEIAREVYGDDPPLTVRQSIRSILRGLEHKLEMNGEGLLLKKSEPNPPKQYEYWLEKRDGKRKEVR